jgi:nucleoside-diphosphate kinase
MDRTLVLVKPDGVKRGIVGDIIHRFEKTGLKLVGLKMVWVEKSLVDKHYPDSRTELLQGIGEKTLQSYKENGKDTVKELGTDDPMKIGQMVNNWNKDFLSSGPIVAMVLEGHHAVPNVRRIVGHTFPSMANPGTIRGDYSLDNPVLANERKRPVINIIHASGNNEEAAYEIDLWFTKGELHSYPRADETVMF